MTIVFVVGASARARASELAAGRGDRPRNTVCARTRYVEENADAQSCLARSRACFSREPENDYYQGFLPRVPAVPLLGFAIFTSHRWILMASGHKRHRWDDARGTRTCAIGFNRVNGRCDRRLRRNIPRRSTKLPTLVRRQSRVRGITDTDRCRVNGQIYFLNVTAAAAATEEGREREEQEGARGYLIVERMWRIER